MFTTNRVWVDIRLPFSLGEKRKLRAARGSGITATRFGLGLWLSSGHLLLSGDGLWFWSEGQKSKVT